jgi:hypothetical protein
MVALALPVALAVGCGDGNDTTHTATPTATRPATTATATSPPATATATSPPATATPPPATATPPNASAQAACAKLERCGQCFTNSTGSCLATDACAQRLAADVAICINAGAACTADMLGDCLFLGCDGADASGDCQ